MLTAAKIDSVPTGARRRSRYEFEIKNSGGTTVCAPTVVGGGSGSTVSWTPTLHARSSISRTRGACGRPSATPAGRGRSNATFRSGAGGYVRGNEVFDPLTNGRTAGNLFGPTVLRAERHHAARFLEPCHLPSAGQPPGRRDVDDDSRRRRRESRRQEQGLLRCRRATDEGDITDDDYRMTAELRGRNYGAPGSVDFRIIAGDGELTRRPPHPAEFRQQPLVLLASSPGRPDQRDLEVQRGWPKRPRASTTSRIGTGSHPYRPEPHLIHLGAPDRPRRRAATRRCPASSTRTSGSRRVRARRSPASSAIGDRNWRRQNGRCDRTPICHFPFSGF